MANAVTNQPTMKVKVYAPLKVYFDGDAVSISAVNDTGPFDVLPRHKNFITLLPPGTIRVRPPGKPEVNISITRGLLHVRADKVIAFLDV